MFFNFVGGDLSRPRRSKPCKTLILRKIHQKCVPLFWAQKTTNHADNQAFMFLLFLFAATFAATCLGETFFSLAYIAALVKTLNLVELERGQKLNPFRVARPQRLANFHAYKGQHVSCHLLYSIWIKISITHCRQLIPEPR